MALLLMARMYTVERNERKEKKKELGIHSQKCLPLVIDRVRNWTIIRVYQLFCKCSTALPKYITGLLQCEMLQCLYSAKESKEFSTKMGDNFSWNIRFPFPLP